MTPRRTESDVRVGFKIRHPDPEKLAYVRQLGVSEVVYLHKVHGGSSLPLSPDAVWRVDELRALQTRLNEAGIDLAAVSNIPYSLCDEVMLGGDGRDEQIERLKEGIRNLGRAGISTLGYYWWPGGVTNDLVRTAWDERTRGGARVSGFDRDDVRAPETLLDREYTREELWENYRYFLEAVVPVAEAAGVTLALHPNDPPIDELAGVPFLFPDDDSLRRAMDLVETDHHELILGLGCLSQRGEPVVDAVRRFGRRDEIAYVHFRDVEGTLPRFRETFVDDGNFDEVAVVRTLHDAGFEGLVLPDHTPELAFDADWDGFVGGYSGRAYTAGYLRGLVNATADG